MIITWIVGLLSVAFIIGPPVIRANLPGAGRRERALAMAGRLALPAPPAPATELERAAESLAAVAVSRRAADRERAQRAAMEAVRCQRCGAVRERHAAMFSHRARIEVCTGDNGGGRCGQLSLVFS